MAASLFVLSASAQPSSALSAVYGRGVHAYFAGNTSQAEQLFTQVIQSGSTDPRPYYFRAMLRLGMGRQFEAENDMRVGASFEARNPGVQHSIGRSLQRVQGPGRRTLEKFRRQARVDRLQQNQQQSQRRYEQLDRRGPAVLRNASPLPLEQPVQPPQNVSVPGAATGSGSSAGSASSAGSGSSNKMAAPAPSQPPQLAPPGPAAPALAEPAPPGSGAKSAEDDIFSTPAPVTPSDDPFGAEPTPTPAPQEPVTEEDPFGELPSPVEDSATEDDLFGGETETVEPATDESDPFGGSAEEEEMTDEATADQDDPFGESSESADESSADEDDPFGESTESSDESTAEEDDDPFGESSEPADESSADEDDPFGESSESSDEGSSDSEPEADEDDPFGEFGSTPSSAADTFAQPSRGSSSTGPASQFFFSLGQWLGSRGNLASQGGSVATAPGVVQADFELGPSDEPQARQAAAELIADEDPFADVASEQPLESTEAEDDPFGEF